MASSSSPSLGSILWTPVIVAFGFLRWVLARTGVLVALLALLAVGRLVARVAPVYLTHYTLHDEAVEIARNPLAGSIRGRLASAVDKAGLSRHVPAECFQVQLARTSIEITCDYQVPVEIIPGLPQRLPMSLRVQEPVVAADAGVKFY